jgi:hypothetical protein
MPRYDDLGKALNLLIHDLRAPLGVAHGYLRLLKEHRLSSTDDQDRALAQSLDSLGRVSRLCTDASAYLTALEAPLVTPEISVTARDLTRRIGEAVQAVGLTWIAPPELAGSIKVTLADVVSAAATAILGSVRRAAGDPPGLGATAQTDDRYLYLLAGTETQRTALFSGVRDDVDPWRGGHGIALPLACLHLAQVSGLVWTTDAGRPGIGIALPLEVPTP